VINVLLVDDHVLVRVGFRHIIQNERGMSAIGEAATGEEAVKFCRAQEPDIVLMDVNMPGMGGLEAAKKIIRYCPDIRIIFVSAHKENPFPAQVMKLGAFGYITKDAPPEELIKAIKQVSSGVKYLSNELAQQVAIGELNVNEDDPFTLLSERELQIMMLLTRGMKVPDIAKQLCLTTKTVNTYRYRTFEKLKVQGDVELTHLAIRHKIIDPEQI
jgi:two-component system invasion response regulator UvrY